MGVAKWPGHGSAISCSERAVYCGSAATAIVRSRQQRNSNESLLWCKYFGKSRQNMKGSTVDTNTSIINGTWMQTVGGSASGIWFGEKL